MGREGRGEGCDVTDFECREANAAQLLVDSRKLMSNSRRCKKLVTVQHSTRRLTMFLLHKCDEQMTDANRIRHKRCYNNHLNSAARRCDCAQNLATHTCAECDIGGFCGGVVWAEGYDVKTSKTRQDLFCCIRKSQDVLNEHSTRQQQPNCALIHIHSQRQENLHMYIWQGKFAVLKFHNKISRFANGNVA